MTGSGALSTAAATAGRYRYSVLAPHRKVSKKSVKIQPTVSKKTHPFTHAASTHGQGTVAALPALVNHGGFTTMPSVNFSVGLIFLCLEVARETKQHFLRKDTPPQVDEIQSD